MFVKEITNGYVFSHLSKDYVFHITHRKQFKQPACKYPREHVIERIRTTNTIWVNNKNEIINEIIYPKQLWFTPVLLDDPVENTIIDIKNMFPNWTKIEIAAIKKL